MSTLDPSASARPLVGTGEEVDRYTLYPARSGSVLGSHPRLTEASRAVAVRLVGAAGAFVSWGKAYPSTQVGPLVRVPSGPLATESWARVPSPSFIPHRPIRPGAEVRAWSLDVRIWAPVRA